MWGTNSATYQTDPSALTGADGLKFARQPTQHGVEPAEPVAQQAFASNGTMTDKVRTAKPIAKKLLYHIILLHLKPDFAASDYGVPSSRALP